MEPDPLLVYCLCNIKCENYLPNFIENQINFNRFKSLTKEEVGKLVSGKLGPLTKIWTEIERIRKIDENDKAEAAAGTKKEPQISQVKPCSSDNITKDQKQDSSVKAAPNSGVKRPTNSVSGKTAIRPRNPTISVSRATNCNPIPIVKPAPTPTVKAVLTRVAKVQPATNKPACKPGVKPIALNAAIKPVTNNTTVRPTCKPSVKPTAAIKPQVPVTNSTITPARNQLVKPAASNAAIKSVVSGTNATIKQPSNTVSTVLNPVDVCRKPGFNTPVTKPASNMTVKQPPNIIPKTTSTAPKATVNSKTTKQISQTKVVARSNMTQIEKRSAGTIVGSAVTGIAVGVAKKHVIKNYTAPLLDSVLPDGFAPKKTDPKKNQSGKDTSEQDGNNNILTQVEELTEDAHILGISSEMEAEAAKYFETFSQQGATENIEVDYFSELGAGIDAGNFSGGFDFSDGIPTDDFKIVAETGGNLLTTVVGGIVNIFVSGGDT